MVGKLTKEDEAAIAQAIAETEKHTSARISVVVRPFSNHYRDFIILYGLILGSAASLALWFDGISSLPVLLCVQLGVILILDMVPWLRLLCIRLVPSRLRHAHSAEAAHREYVALHAGMPKDEPLAFLFVSLAERYVHVITNPAVHAKIPENWDIVTSGFIAAVRAEGLRTACVEAIERMAEILSPHFPPVSP